MHPACEIDPAAYWIDISDAHGIFDLLRLLRRAMSGHETRILVAHGGL